MPEFNRFPSKAYALGLRIFLCDCSRMTVWRVLQRVNVIGIGLDELSGMSEKELAYLLFPERAKPGDGYLIPDFKWEEFQMVKHRSSIRLCWRRYCKRAAKQNLTAYSWKFFLTSYNDYRRPKIQVDDPNDTVVREQSQSVAICVRLFPFK